MITDYPIPNAPYRHQKAYKQVCGISLLLAAAVVNQNFRTLLLTDPQRALDDGYHGEVFPLNPKEKKLILSIQAESLSDFALQITSRPKLTSEGGCGQWTPVNQPALAFKAE